MERPSFVEIPQNSILPELAIKPATQDIERESLRPSMLSRLNLAQRVFWDTFNPYSREMSDPIPGYSQRKRRTVRKWRTRGGHLIHTVGLVTSFVPPWDTQYFAYMAGTFVGMIYLDFIEKSKNKRDFFRRIHQIYPLFPKPAASITHHVANTDFEL